MGISLVRFKQAEQIQRGVLREQEITPLVENYPGLGEVLTRGIEAVHFAHQQTTGKRIALEDVYLLSPVTAPARILCQGLNYPVPKGSEQKPSPEAFFRKDETALCGAFQDIVRPPNVKLLDMEVELGLIIGKPIYKAMDISAAQLDQYVVGLTLANDLSARDITYRDPAGQWYQGKSYRTFCPVGPAIYLLQPGEISLLSELELKLWVNGELRQQASTGDMLCPPAKALSLASHFTDFAVGDLLLTGTCGQTELQAPNPLVKKIGDFLFSEKKQMEIFINRQDETYKFLQPGDEIEAKLTSRDGKLQLTHRNTIT